MTDRSRKPRISAEVEYVEYETVEFIDFWILRRADGAIEHGRGMTIPEVRDGDRLWYTVETTRDPVGIKFR